MSLATDMTGRRGRALLMSAAFSHKLTCTAGPRVGDAVTAVCALDDGAPLSDALKAAHVQTDWAAWR